MSLRTLVVCLAVGSLALIGPDANAQGQGDNNGVAHRVEALEAQVAALQTHVATLEGQATALLAELAAHKAEVSAHHVRYTDAEAEAAVGPHFSGDHADLANVQPDQHHVATDASAIAQDVADLQDLLFHFSRNGNVVTIIGADVIVEHGNLHVRNGLGGTSTTNGYGNVIIGYNEPFGSPLRTGSHMLVVGMEHEYTSYAGIVAGRRNTVTGQYSSVTGGFLGTASGPYSSVSGGYINTASGERSSVSGGANNTASGNLSSVTGGRNNSASIYYSSVNGGYHNTASGNYSSVTGGYYNTAGGQLSSITAGYQNTASGSFSSVSGGNLKNATNLYAHPDTHTP